MQVSTIGVDLAKNVFQVHGVDSAGKVVITRQLRRKQVIDFFSKIPPCLVGMEPAEPLIIGRVKSPSSVTPCA
jgi:transposase